MKTRARDMLFGRADDQGEAVDLVGAGPSDGVPQALEPDELEDPGPELLDEGEESDQELEDGDDAEDDLDGDVDGNGELELSDEDDEEAALWFADQRAAESAYNELRAYANQLQNIVNAGPQNTREVPEEPQLAASDIAQIAQSDPLGAFNYAMENQPEAASQVIAQVNAHAAQFAASAQIAREDGDEEAASQWDHRSMSAAALAEQMREQRMRAEFEQELAPAREREFEQDLLGAAQRLTQRYTDAPQYAAEIDEILQSNPAMIGTGTTEELEWAMETALHRVRAANIDQIVAQKVAEQLQAARQGDRVTSKSRAAGASGGRATAQRTASPDDDEADDVRSSVLQGNPSGQSWRQMMFG